VPVQTARTFETGAPSKVFDAPYVLALGGGSLGRMYDISPDGRRFLMFKDSGGRADEPLPARIILVQNWFEELKRRVPTK
jgi:hypothetical protein